MEESSDAEDLTIMDANVTEAATTTGKHGGPKGSTPPAKLVCVDDSTLDASQAGLEIELKGQEMQVGRSASNDVALKSPKVSGHHATLLVAYGSWGVKDQGSTNGVFINDERISQERRLRSGDYVRFGPVKFRFVLDRPEMEADEITSVGSGQPPQDNEEMETIYGNQVGDHMAQLEEKRHEEEELEATVRQDEETRAPAATMRETLDHDDQTAAKQPASQGSTGMKLALVGGGVLVVVAAMAFWLLGSDNSDQLAVENAKILKRFSVAHEDLATLPNKDQTKKHFNELDKHAKKIDETHKAHPNHLQIQDQVATVLFYRFERHFHLALAEGKLKQAEKEINQTLKQMHQLGLVTSGKGGGQRRVADDVVALLGIAGEMVTIRNFKQRFPDPSKSSSKDTPPKREEILAYSSAQDRLVLLKQNPQTNMAMKVRFQLFGYLVEEMLKRDVPLLNQWQAFM
ncbi:MAG: FHA domain-containing protein [Magnetococcales bacterium]|nr:FHA domain-containing protein [Magnetococcales bacterium]